MRQRLVDVDRVRDLADLTRRAHELIEEGQRAVLGITGVPGSGTSTLARCLLETLGPNPPAGLPVDGWVAHVSTDGFRRADGEPEHPGRRDRHGAPDTFDAAGYVAMLRRLTADSGETVFAPAFDDGRGLPVAGAVPVPPQARLILTDGPYLLIEHESWRPLRTMLDEVWYCDDDEDRRMHLFLRRHIRLGRSADSARRWALSRDEANAALIRATRPAADLVVPDAVLASLSTPDHDFRARSAPVPL